jgi:hypothetical protein
MLSFCGHWRFGDVMEIRLEPDLSHCIETVAKREYERVLSLLLKGCNEDKPLEDELELKSAA